MRWSNMFKQQTRFVTQSVRRRARRAMSNFSEELCWSVVRDTSSYLLRRKQSGRCAVGKRGAEFTTEPNNLTGLNAWKYSGLANAKTIEIAPAGEKGIVMSTKSRNSARIGKVSCCQHARTPAAQASVVFVIHSANAHVGTRQ